MAGGSNVVETRVFERRAYRRFRHDALRIAMASLPEGHHAHTGDRNARAHFVSPLITRHADVRADSNLTRSLPKVRRWEAVRPPRSKG
jgi:hypothetical protein